MKDRAVTPDPGGVHNHPPYGDPGTTCPEYLIGKCRIDYLHELVASVPVAVTPAEAIRATTPAWANVIDVAKAAAYEAGRRSVALTPDLLREAVEQWAELRVAYGRGDDLGPIFDRHAVLASDRLRAALAGAASSPALDRVAATVYFTADDIDAALLTIRGSVTRDESIVMAAAGAAASAMRTGGVIVSKDRLATPPTDDTPG